VDALHFSPLQVQIPGRAAPKFIVHPRRREELLTLPSWAALSNSTNIGESLGSCLTLTDLHVTAIKLAKLRGVHLHDLETPGCKELNSQLVPKPQPSR
jgi:hypothetical protein